MNYNHDNSDTDRRADSFDQHRDDNSNDHNPAIFGQVGTGKTQQLGTELARRVADTDSTVFIDPKGTRGGGKNGE